MKSQWLSR